MKLSLKYKISIFTLIIIIIGFLLNTYIVIHENKKFISQFISRMYKKKRESYSEKRKTYNKLLNQNHNKLYNIILSNLIFDIKTFISQIELDLISGDKLAQGEKIIGLSKRLSSESSIYIIKKQTILISSEKKIWNTNIHNINNPIFPVFDKNNHVSLDGYKKNGNIFYKNIKNKIIFIKDKDINSPYIFIIIYNKETINNILTNQQAQINQMVSQDIARDNHEEQKDKINLKTHLIDIQKRNVLVSIFISIIIFFMLLLVSIIIIKKILKIKKGIEITGKGNLKHKVNLNSIIKDELDDFTYEFNKLTSKLNDIKLNEIKKIINQILPVPETSIKDIKINSFNLTSKDIGGDFYDIILIGNRLILSLGDVVGKSAPAAFLTGITISSIRSILKIQPEIDINLLILKLNDILKELTEPGKWITLVILEINLTNYEISIFNCGHTPVLFYNKKTVELFKSEFPMVGEIDTKILKKYIFSAQTILNKNSGLLLYSDGVIETRNKFEDFYGVDKLKKFFKKYFNVSDNLPVLIFEEIKMFSEAKYFNDDITMTYIRR